jgi:UDP-N-acetylmuramoyl-L-alanyl-D-glutamate--2,6-diaminopimelate ligase
MYVDREEAIHHAIQEAGEGDIVLIAGKGHETYQIIGNQKIHFSDQEVARREILK